MQRVNFLTSENETRKTGRIEIKLNCNEKYIRIILSHVFL